MSSSSATFATWSLSYPLPKAHGLRGSTWGRVLGGSASPAPDWTSFQGGPHPAALVFSHKEPGAALKGFSSRTHPVLQLGGKPSPRCHLKASTSRIPQKRHSPIPCAGGGASSQALLALAAGTLPTSVSTDRRPLTGQLTPQARAAEGRGPGEGSGIKSGVGLFLFRVGVCCGDPC